MALLDTHLQPLPSSLEVTSVVLQRYVDSGPVPDDAFSLQQSTINVDGLEDGHVVVEVLYLSVDPYMRPLMRINQNHYAPSFPLGKPLSGGAVVLVRASKAEGFKPGDVLTGRPFPWSTFSVLGPEELKACRRVPERFYGNVRLSKFLGTLGMPGLTAYSSIKKIAEPKEGETAYVSAASGAVGQVAGQLLKKVYGCRVVGSAGSQEKLDLLRHLGYDAVWNHREVPIREALKEHCPDGIDIYFENVGGATLEAVIDAANTHCRIVACGMISQYDLAAEERYGVKNLFQIVAKQIKMQGFIVSSLAVGMQDDFDREMGEWVLKGKILAVDHVTKGIESIGEAFRSMMQGGNLGKAVVQVVGRDPVPVLV